MTQASETRRRLASRIAEAYAACPAVKAVLLGGSTARGDADRFSDIEVGVFWSELPADEERLAAIARAGGDVQELYPYDTAEGGAFDDWRIGRRDGAPKTGVSVETVHTTAADVEKALDAALRRFDPAGGHQVLLAALVEGLPLHGHDLLERWRTGARDYPDGLATAVVNRYAQLDHFWRFEMFRERDNRLIEARAIAEIHEGVLRTLLAVNRVYFFGFKHLEAITQRLGHAPPDLFGRIRAAYRAEPEAVETDLAELVEQTYDLVEAHVPSVDVERLRLIFRYRRPLWENLPTLDG